MIGGKRMERRMIRGKRGSSRGAKTRGEQREKLEGKRVGEEGWGKEEEKGYKEGISSRRVHD